MIDGMDGDICDFEIFNNSKEDFQLFDFVTDPPNAKPCLNKEICYSLPGNIQTLSTAGWSLPNNAEVISGGNPNDRQVCLKFNSESSGFLDFLGEDECLISHQGNLDLEVNTVRFEIDTFICPGRFIVFENLKYDTAITTEINYPGDGIIECDTILNLKISIVDTSPVQIEYIIDSFINALSFRWNKPLGAEEFDIFINDSLVSQQSFAAFIYTDTSGVDSIKFSVLPSNSLGCRFSKKEIIISVPDFPSAIQALPESYVQIFPNPSDNIFSIESKIPIENLSLFDFSGRKIEVQNLNKIDLSAEAAGIYFLKITTKSGYLLKKIIKL